MTDIKDMTWGFTGGEDFIHVVSVDLGDGYSWAEFHEWYSPGKRRYFWDYGAGCSCDSWGADLRSPDDMRSGSKADLERSLRGFRDDYGSSDEALLVILDALARVKRFRKPENKGGGK